VRIAVLLIATLCLTTACTRQFEPFRADYTEWTRADGDCRVKALQTPNPYATQAVYDACMQANGWRPKA
jgi:Tfp pilus assembly protein PilP